MNRLIKSRLLYLFVAASLLIVGAGCTEDPTWNKPKPTVEEVIPAVFIEDVVMPDASEVFIPEDPLTIQGTGFDKYDIFIFRPTAAEAAEDESQCFQAKITEVTDDHVTIIIPQTIILRDYELILKRYNKQQVLGEMTIQKAHFPAIPDVNGMTVKGRVFCGKKAIPNVVVSDGVLVTKTDENGIYYLASEKQMGYVFISIPSGYNIESQAGYSAFPALSQTLTGEANEQHDFALTEVPGGNQSHVMMVFTDLHLASKTPNTAGKYSDLDQYKDKFIPDITAEMGQYTNVYALCLGDITWDAFWYKDMSSPENMVEVRYQLPNYKDLMKDFPCQIFNVIGNHDNDPKVLGDFLTEKPFKEHIAPTYYSFNIGDIHYIVLDNDQYDNYNGGSRIETIGLNGTSDPQRWQMAWIAEDLKYVDKSKKVVVAMHAPMTSAGLEPAVTLSGGNELLSLLQGYQVEFLTGHTHNNHHATIAPGVREHNVAAVCGTWWFNVKSANGGAAYDMCRDGSPTGYGVFKFTGTDVQWYYKGIEVDRNEQFAIYDMNLVDKAYLSALGGKTNELLINVWNWDENWTVSVTENDTPLTATRVYRKDPVHYSWQKKVLEPAHEPGSPNSTYLTNSNAHMFSVITQVPGSTVKVVVTDPFGQSYEKSIKTQAILAQWQFAKGVNVDEFVVDNKMPAAVGTGYISYISNCDPALDVNNKIAREVGSTGEPYITGGWPGDWWLFTIPNVTIPAGTVINAKFYARASGTGMKYWMLEYYDGGEWKVGAPLLSTEVEGEPISYTHEMVNTTHHLVDQDLTFEHAINNGEIQIRFRCMANWQASGAGALAAPNGGTHRISKQNDIDPTISIVTE